MDAPTFQKYLRLLKAPALAALTAFYLGSCARPLKSEADISQAPVELKQTIAALSPEQLSSVTPPEAPTAPAPAETAEPGKKAPPPKKIRLKTKKTKKSASPQAEKIEGPVTWSPKEWPFGVGEKITWVLRYGLIEGGIATLSVEEPQVLEGEPVLHYKGVVKSSKVLEFFYKIDNQMDTWVRLKDHLPLRQEIRQLESARWGRRVVLFNPETMKAKFFQTMTNADNKKEEILREDDMTPYAQDIFGALFFARFIGDATHVNFPVHDRWRNWSNELTYVDKEKIHVPAGDFETTHYKSFPRVSGALQPKGDIDLWIANDPSHILLKFQAKLKVGAITGEVKSIEAGHPFTFPPPVMKTPIDLKLSGEIPPIQTKKDP